MSLGQQGELLVMASECVLKGMPRELNKLRRRVELVGLLVVHLVHLMQNGTGRQQLPNEVRRHLVRVVREHLHLHLMRQMRSTLVELQLVQARRCANYLKRRELKLKRVAL